MLDNILSTVPKLSRYVRNNWKRNGSSKPLRTCEVWGNMAVRRRSVSKRKRYVQRESTQYVRNTPDNTSRLTVCGKTARMLRHRDERKKKTRNVSSPAGSLLDFQARQYNLRSWLRSLANSQAGGIVGKGVGQHSPRWCDRSLPRARVFWEGISKRVIGNSDEYWRENMGGC
jgi:hypothetical protein